MDFCANYSIIRVVLWQKAEPTANKNELFSFIFRLKMGKKELTSSGLVVLAVLANLVPVSVFFGVDFIFGSIFALLLVSISGLRAGILAGFLASVCTVIYWEHFYAIPILTVEILFVGLLISKYNKIPIILADMIYWLLIGMPLIYICYRYALAIDANVAKLIMFKQVMNGLFNASIASIMIFSAQLFWGVRFKKIPKPSLRYVIFTILAFCLIGCCLTIVGFESNRNELTRTKDLCKNIDRFAIETKYYLENWHTRNINAALNLSNLISAQSAKLPEKWLDEFGNLASSENNPYIQLIAECGKQADSGFYDIRIANSLGTVIAANPQTNSTGEKIIGTNLSQIDVYKNKKNNIRPIVSEVYTPTASRTPVITITVPILYNNKFIGCVAVSHKIEAIVQNLRALQPDSNYNINVRDGSSNIVASTISSLEPLEVLSSTRFTLKQTVYKDIKHYTARDFSAISRYKNSWFAVARPAGISGWEIAIAYPAQVLQNELTAFVSTAMLVTYVVLLIGCPIILLLSTIFTSPIKSLSKISETLKDTKLYDHSNIDINDSAVEEISELAVNIKSLVEKHREQINGLEEEIAKLQEKNKD